MAAASAATRAGFDIPVRIHLELPAAAELAAKNNTGKAPKTLRLWETESDQKRCCRSANPTARAVRS